jgi:hypothetical protein
MPLGSFASGALADVDPDALARMLTLDETVFVEHKKSFHDESAYRIACSIAAFANTVGGWLLLGVHGGAPVKTTDSWATDGSPTLVDSLRDRLRAELDPLPAFEARVMQHNGIPVGVVRVYESSDTPHVMIATGSVYVREVAGQTDVTVERKPGPALAGERTFKAQQIRSRQQLLELAQRGACASRRVDELLDPSRSHSLMRDRLDLKFVRDAHGEWRAQERTFQRASIFVRVAPFTLPARFRGWSTTAAAAASVLRAGEALTGRIGLGHDWPIPEPSGVAFTMTGVRVAGHQTGSQQALEGAVSFALDARGLVGAALHLDAPDDPRRRQWLTATQLARMMISPVVEAAMGILDDGEFVGRARCQIDLVGLSRAMLIEGQSDRGPKDHVPTSEDITLAVENSADIVAQLAANALARSAGQPMWDPPPGPH